MATKKVLKYGTEYVPAINDNPSSEFGNYETYSRSKIEERLSGAGGYNWEGRTLYFDGDSLTVSGVDKWSKYTADKLNCNSINNAIGGQPIFPDIPGTPQDYRQRISRIPSTVDLILIDGDFNAAWNVAKTTEECFDKSLSTWAGRWNAAMEGLRRSFPNVPIILCSPWATDPTTSSKNIHILKYNANAMLTMARYWGCYFFDLATESPMQLNFGWGWWSSTGTSNVHNNKRAAELVGQVLADKIATIPAPIWSAEDTISLDQSEVTVAVGSTVRVTPTMTGNFTNAWTSSDYNVACVLGGQIIGMAAGTATITATTRNGNTATCTVTVTAS